MGERRLRCYAEQRRDGYSEALCLDLGLAVQADTMEEAIAKLDQQIKSYIRDAVEGEDRAFQDELLNRKLPFPYWAKYYLYYGLWRLRCLMSHRFKPFYESIPFPAY